MIKKFYRQCLFFFLFSQAVCASAGTGLNGIIPAAYTFNQLPKLSQTLVLDDGTGKIDVYVDYSIAKAIPSLSKANKLDVVGVVDEYNGVLEIKPGNPDQVRILS